MFTSFQNLCSAVTATDKNLLITAQNHLDNLTKPVGSLGRLEEFAAKLFTVYQGKFPLQPDPALHILAAADHGVFEEGVAQNPQEVTHLMILNILQGGAAISVLTKQNKMDMLLLDAGHKGDCPKHAHARRVNPLAMSGNIAKEDAMSPALCEELILAGANAVAEGVKKGYRIFSIGEMGIANSTPATALFAEFFDLDPMEITGPGAGLSKERVVHKAKVVVLGSCAMKCPVIIDGFIATSAYAAAYCMDKNVQDYAFLSHASAEPGYQKIVRCLGQKPMLDLSMRLGEGTGASLALQLLRSAAVIYNEMATFKDANIETDTYLTK